MPLLCLQMDVLCTHPMFGPDSGKGSWVDLNFMFEKVRVGEDPRRQERVETFLQASPHHSLATSLQSGPSLQCSSSLCLRPCAACCLALSCPIEAGRLCRHDLLAGMLAGLI